MIKPLLFVLAISAVTAWLTRRCFADWLTPAHHTRALLLLALVTAVLFVAPGPWVFLLIFAAILWVASHLQTTHPATNLAIFFLFMPALPPVIGSLSGFGGIQSFIDMNPLRVATIILLVPVCLDLMKKIPPGRPNPFAATDAAVLGYQVLRLIHQSDDISGTAIAREVVTVFLDVWVPYYSFSRGIRTADDFKFIFGHFVLICTLMAGIALFEAQKKWILYSDLQNIYNQWTLTNVLMRGESIRAQATTTQPIILAIVQCFGIAMFFAIHPSTWRTRAHAIVLLFLLGGLFVTLSRGPWIGTGLMLASLYFLSRVSIDRYRMGLIFGFVFLIVAKVIGLDDYIFQILKAIFGSEENDTGTIEYRRELLETSLVLIGSSPWFGVPNYAAYMQHLVQGEGIIDLVNVYLAETLNYGLTGLAIYIAPFFIGIRAMLKWLAHATDTPEKYHVRALLSVTVGILVIIFTTSTTGMIRLLMMVTYAVAIAQMTGGAPQKRFPWE